MSRSGRGHLEPGPEARPADKLPAGPVGQENGTFFAGENIIGQSSGAIYVLDKYMLLSEVPAAGSVENIDSYDQNDLFEGEADMILDFTEVNPFGDV